MEQWSNQACYGYAITAERAGFTEAQIKQLTRKMHRIHDEVSVEEATKHYRESDY